MSRAAAQPTPESRPIGGRKCGQLRSTGLVRRGREADQSANRLVVQRHSTTIAGQREVREAYAGGIAQGTGRGRCDGIAPALRSWISRRVAQSPVPTSPSTGGGLDLYLACAATDVEAVLVVLRDRAPTHSAWPKPNRHPPQWQGVEGDLRCGQPPGGSGGYDGQTTAGARIPARDIALRPTKTDPT